MNRLAVLEKVSYNSTREYSDSDNGKETRSKNASTRHEIMFDEPNLIIISFTYADDGAEPEEDRQLQQLLTRQVRILRSLLP